MRRRFVLTPVLTFTIGLAVAVPASAATPDEGTAPNTTAIVEPGLRWRVGYVNMGFSDDEPAVVSIYDDGQIVIAEPSEPYGFLAGQLDDATLRRLDELAAAVEPDAEYGEVMVSDIGDTVVTFGGESPVVVAVWGLSQTDGLPAHEREARQRLTRLVEALVGAADQAADITTYLPERVDVGLVQVPADEPVAAAPWPLAALPEDLARPAGTAAWCVDAARDEVPVPPFDWSSPWGDGERTWPHPLETWFVDEVMIDRVLPTELPGRDWDSTRWSWYDVRVADPVEG